ncbi:MAG: hypothetical protein IKI63_06875 [Clostridia bacterium]|nr:hypothetical protein [Clostridia bacterium]
MLTFTVRGVRVQISLLFPAAVVWLCAGDRSGAAARCLFASLWHESGHLLALACFHLRPRALTFGAFGMRLSVPCALSSRQRRRLALAGPLFNFAAATLLLAVGERETAALHLLLGWFNLLPVQPLDGGQALYFALSPRWGDAAASRVLAVTSAAVVLPLTAAGAWVLWQSGYNASLLFVCAYLILLLTLKKRC